jgi:glucose-1-phosphatase
MSSQLLVGVEAIIFDLGGVIINLDTSRTISSFANLSGLNHDQIISLTHSEKFLAYERGNINDEEFRSFVRSRLNDSLSSEQIDQAWNAMILDIPKTRIDLLRKLSQQLPTFILSNTNNIHIEFVERELLPSHHIRSFKEIVHKDYYSHLMGKRKPDPEIFQRLLDENNLSTIKTLLVDDNIQNIEAAKMMGFKTYLVPPNQLNLNLFI